MGKKEKQDVEMEQKLSTHEMYARMMEERKRREENRYKKNGRINYEKKVTFKDLNRYADKWDYLMMAFGVIAALAGGMMMPVFFLLMGDMMNDFGSMSSIPAIIPTLRPDQIKPFLDQMIEGMMDMMDKNITYMLILGAVSFVCSLIIGLCGENSAQRQGDKILKAYFTSALSQEVGWFDATQTGAITAAMGEI